MRPETKDATVARVHRFLSSNEFATVIAVMQGSPRTSDVIELQHTVAQYYTACGIKHATVARTRVLPCASFSAVMTTLFACVTSMHESTRSQIVVRREAVELAVVTSRDAAAAFLRRIPGTTPSWSGRGGDCSGLDPVDIMLDRNGMCTKPSDALCSVRLR